MYSAKCIMQSLPMATSETNGNEDSAASVALTRFRKRKLEIYPRNDG